MNYELELIEILSEWLTDNPGNDGFDFLLRNETNRLEKVLIRQLMSLTNKTQLQTCFQVNINKLTEIGDNLYDRENKDNKYAALVLELVMKLRKTVFLVELEDFEIPLLLRKINGDKFQAQWQSLENRLKAQLIAPDLLEIIGFAYANYVRTRPQWSNDNYLHFFNESLQELPSQANSDFIINLLISLGYNYSRFTVYCFRWMRQRTEGKSGEEKLKELLTLKKNLRQLQILSSSKFEPRKRSILDELLKWIDEELSVQPYEQTTIPANPQKINTKLKVLELAYWHKLQYDHGIYEENNLDALSEKVAFNFTSKGQDELSASSIKSKFYPKDRAIIAPVEEMLVKMLEDVRQFLQ